LRATPLAALRGSVQLALVATIVTAVLQSILLSGCALLFMALVAVQTSARRLRPLRHAS
jgi:hypothetical protein